MDASPLNTWREYSSLFLTSQYYALSITLVLFQKSIIQFLQIFFLGRGAVVHPWAIIPVQKLLEAIRTL